MQTCGHELHVLLVILRLLNTLFPKLAIRINSKGDYALRENVSVFLTACQHLGLREEDCFAVNDLWEQKNLAQVTSTLISIADLVMCSIYTKIFLYFLPYFP